MLKKGTKGLYRKFSILPIPSGKVIHLTITSTTLYELLRKTLTNHRESLPSLKQFRKKKEVWWNTLFRKLKAIVS